VKYFFIVIIVFHFSNVQACACCGIDNTWGTHKIKYGDYPTSIVKDLTYKSGSLDDGPIGELFLEVNDTKFSQKSIIFNSKNGPVQFDFEAIVEHKELDMTFVVNEDYKMTDEAKIYHEFIFNGVITISDEIRKMIGAENLPVVHHGKFIIQGVGNSCIQDGTFKKWLLKIDGHPVFTLHGLIAEKQLTQTKDFIQKTGQ
jgi:hypothetical protein